MFDLVTCKHTKNSAVIYDTEWPCWDQVSLNNIKVHHKPISIYIHYPAPKQNPILLFDYCTENTAPSTQKRKETKKKSHLLSTSGMKEDEMSFYSIKDIRYKDIASSAICEQWKKDGGSRKTICAQWGLWFWSDMTVLSIVLCTHKCPGKTGSL